MRNLYILIILFVAGLTSEYKGQTCTPLTITDAWGSDNIQVDCSYVFNSSNCVTLSTSLPTLRQTTTYTTESIPFSPVIPFNAGTPLNANYDDVFAELIDIPFTFCFFGNSYNQLVFGSNGLLTFDTEYLDQISYPNVEAQNPSPVLPGNSIYGVLQDLVFSNLDSSEIYYSVLDTGSCRKLIINFFEGRTPGCTTRSSTQIVLTEYTNEIEIYVDRKPLPCETARFNNAVLGIINADGTVGYSPTGRNTGVWQATAEAWKFTPAGAIVNPVVEWFSEDGTKIGSGNSINVCPTQSMTYTAKASYNICNNPLVLTDTIDFTVAADFPVARNYTRLLCTPVGTSQTVNLNDYQQFLTPQSIGNFTFSYHATQADANVGINPLASEVTLNSQRTFYVRIQSNSNPACYRVAQLTFQFISRALITNNITLCDANNDGVENNFVLSTLTPQLLSGNTPGTVTYYLSQADADTQSNPVTTVNLTSGMTLWLRFATSTCAQVLGPVTINFRPGPAVNTPLNFTVTTCDINDDNAEPYNYQVNVSPSVSSDPNVTFSYFATFQEAFTGTGTPLTTVQEGAYSVYVRVEDASGCFSIGEVRMNVVFTKVEVTATTVNLCFDGSEDITVDLNALSGSMLISPSTGISVSYHTSNANAQAGSNPISPTQIITQDGNSVTARYFVRFEQSEDCYTVRPLTIVLTHPIAVQNNFSRCDTNNDGTETFTLSSYNSRIAGSQSATIKYFLTEADAEADTNAVTTLNLSSPVQLFVRVTVNSCTEVYRINFSLTPTPEVLPDLVVNRSRVCDNNNDELEAYNLTVHEDEIYSGSDAVNFSYFTRYEGGSLSGSITNPTRFNASEQNTVYVRVAFAGTGCFSVSKLVINLDFIPAPILREATLRICDEQFNFGETFNLSEAIPQLFIQEENTEALNGITVTYYNTQAEANAGVASTQIGATKSTLQSLVTVYARFQVNATGCFTVAPIYLRTYFPPKAINSVINGICDSNLDGLYEVNLMNFTAQMVDIPDPEQKFFFYRTQADAQNESNPIENPGNFTVSTLPFTLYVKVENIPGCNDISTVQLRAGLPLPANANGPFVLEQCDSGNDGTELVNLTQFQDQIFPGGSFEYYASMSDLNNGANAIANPTSFSSADASRIFVKVSYSGYCPVLREIEVDLKPTPMFDLPVYYFCPYDNGSVDIQPNLSNLNIVSYEWRNPSGTVVSTTNQLLDVNVTGNYSLTVTAQNGCTFAENFEVRHYEVPIITQLSANGNTYTVTATGSRTILYSIDGVTWQTGNVFYNLPVGQTTFYVKFSGEDCLGLPKKGVVLNIPNAFTPNEDGVNDIWEVNDLNVFDGALSSVQVFDRQQVVVHQQEAADRLYWDGRWLGRPVPTGTYWYVIKLPDGRSFFGWVFLKNRN